MYTLTERNERRSRRSALTLAVLFHLALAALLYLATAESPQPQPPVKKDAPARPAAPDPRTASVEP